MERQKQLRELMRKSKASGAEKLKHPLASYNNFNQLICVLCNVAVKSELHWPAHLNSKSHKETVTAAQQHKQQLPQKQQASAIEAVSQGATVTSPKPAEVTSDETLRSNSELPSGFFDNGSDFPQEQQPNQHQHLTKTNTLSALPAGFFDDSAAELRANPVKANEEWEAFEREVVAEANRLQADESVTVVTDTAAEETDDEDEEYNQLRNDAEEAVVELEGYSRLERLKQEAENKKRILADQIEEHRAKRVQVSALDDTSEDEDELFDWRTKTLS